MRICIIILLLTYDTVYHFSNVKQTDKPARKKSRKQDESEEESCDSSVSTEESKLDSVACSDDSVEDDVTPITNVAQAEHLINTAHNDSEDDAVYKCTRVEREVYDGVPAIVVYRRRWLASKKWGVEQSKKDQCVYADTIQRYHVTKSYNEKMNDFFNPPSIITTSTTATITTTVTNTNNTKIAKSKKISKK